MNLECYHPSNLGNWDFKKCQDKIDKWTRWRQVPCTQKSMRRSLPVPLRVGICREENSAWPLNQWPCGPANTCHIPRWITGVPASGTRNPWRGGIQTPVWGVKPDSSCPVRITRLAAPDQAVIRLWTWTTPDKDSMLIGSRFPFHLLDLVLRYKALKFTLGRPLSTTLPACFSRETKTSSNIPRSYVQPQLGKTVFKMMSTSLIPRDFSTQVTSQTFCGPEF